MWRSAAGQEIGSGWWIIDNSICNTGSVPLVVDWPKAELANDAYSPLSPGRELFYRITIGSAEPVAIAAPLQYGGYVSQAAETQVYGLTSTNQRRGSILDSVLGGPVSAGAQQIDRSRPSDINGNHRNGGTAGSSPAVTLGSSSGDSHANAPPEISPDAFKIRIQASYGHNGYQFTARSESGNVAGLRLAIATSQTAAFLHALRKAGISASVAPLDKLAAIPTDSSLLRISQRPFVVMPLSSDGLPLTIFVPTKGSGIEIATAVVLVNGSHPAMVGKISLFE